MTNRLCAKCKCEFTPTTDFGRDFSYCKKCTSTARQKQWAKNKERIAAQNRASYIKIKYGLDRNAYEALLKSQNGVCDICKVERTLAVDHDHASGKTRGLLCRSCNTALGMLKDDCARLEAAISYLNKHKKEI